MCFVLCLLCFGIFKQMFVFENTFPFSQSEQIYTRLIQLITCSLNVNNGF
jgi:hypothetical protein